MIQDDKIAIPYVHIMYNIVWDIIPTYLLQVFSRRHHDAVIYSAENNKEYHSCPHIVLTIIYYI